MSIAICEQCDGIIDTDEDEFSNIEDYVICENCIPTLQIEH